MTTKQSGYQRRWLDKLYATRDRAAELEKAIDDIAAVLHLSDAKLRIAILVDQAKAGRK